jgi:septal ring factor EnvC (AmiA/AmiB activator)
MEKVISIISICFSGITLVVLLITFFTTRKSNIKKDTAEDERELASLREGIFKANMKLDQVCATTNETRSDIKAMDQKLVEHGEKIAVITRDLETAFMRIDELRDQINKEEKHE